MDALQAVIERQDFEAPGRIEQIKVRLYIAFRAKFGLECNFEEFWQYKQPGALQWITFDPATTTVECEKLRLVVRKINLEVECPDATA